MDGWDNGLLAKSLEVITQTNAAEFSDLVLHNQASLK